MYDTIRVNSISSLFHLKKLTLKKWMHYPTASVNTGGEILWMRSVFDFSGCDQISQDGCCVCVCEFGVIKGGQAPPTPSSPTPPLRIDEQLPPPPLPGSDIVGTAQSELDGSTQTTWFWWLCKYNPISPPTERHFEKKIDFHWLAFELPWFSHFKVHRSKPRFGTALDKHSIKWKSMTFLLIRKKEWLPMLYARVPHGLGAIPWCLPHRTRTNLQMSLNTTPFTWYVRILSISHRLHLSPMGEEMKKNISQ